MQRSKLQNLVSDGLPCTRYATWVSSLMISVTCRHDAAQACVGLVPKCTPAVVDAEGIVKLPLHRSLVRSSASVSVSMPTFGAVNYHDDMIMPSLAELSFDMWHKQRLQRGKCNCINLAPMSYLQQSVCMVYALQSLVDLPSGDGGAENTAA